MFGGGYHASSEGRGQHRGCPAYFLRPWYRQYCSSDHIPGWSPPVWASPLGVSDPGGNMADGTAPAEDTGREVEIHLGSDGKGGGGFLMMEEYIGRRHNTVVQYIAT